MLRRLLLPLIILALSTTHAFAQDRRADAEPNG